MNNLLVGIILSNVLVGTLVWVFMDYKIKKIENHNQALLDDDKMIIDEQARLLVECYEQSHKSHEHKHKN